MWTCDGKTENDSGRSYSRDGISRHRHSLKRPLEPPVTTAATTTAATPIAT